MRRQEQLPIIGLYGAWYSPDHLGLLVDAMAEHGRRLIVPKTYLDDPDARYSDDADHIAGFLSTKAELGTADGVHIMAHSRSANIGPLLPKRIPVKSITYVCGGIPPTAADIKNSVVPLDTSNKYTDDFRKGVLELGDGSTSFNPELAPGVLLNKCEPDVVAFALKAFQAQRRREQDVVLHQRPVGIVEHAVVASHDQAIKPQWQIARGILLLGASAVEEIEADHSPFLSRPQQLAGLLVHYALSAEAN